VVEATLEHLPADKPRYLMGVGTPEEIVEYSRLGVDMRIASCPRGRRGMGLLFTSEGKISIKQARYAQDAAPLDPNCRCRVCQRYSRAYLRHLYASNEVLAQVLNTQHNLSFYLTLCGGCVILFDLGKSDVFSSFWSRPETVNLPGKTPGSKPEVYDPAGIEQHPVMK